MAITLKKQTLNPKDVNDVLSSIRYAPPSQGEQGTVSVLGSPPVYLATFAIHGHQPKTNISIHLEGYSSFLILSRYFHASVVFTDWYPLSKRPSKRQRDWTFSVGCIKFSVIRRWGEGKG